MIKGRGKIMLISLIVLGVLVFAFCGFLLITNYRLGKIPAMTFQDTLEYVTKNDSKTVITVGKREQLHQILKICFCTQKCNLKKNLFLMIVTKA